MSEEVVKVKAYVTVGGKTEAKRFLVPADMCKNLVFLQEKLKKVYYQLLNKDFSISWKDRDGDEIQISNDDELSEAITDFMKSNKKDEPFKITVKIGGPSKKQVSYCTSAPFKSEGSLHEDVVCDACKNEVKGFRYKCIQCVDFDLCGDCEGKGQHTKHSMIRLVKPIPRQSQHLLQKVIQYCCQAFISLESAGGFIPPWEAMPPPPPHMFADPPYFEQNADFTSREPGKEGVRMPGRENERLPNREEMGMPRMGAPGMGMPGPGMPGMGMPGMGMPGMGMPGMGMPRMGEPGSFPPDFPGPPPPEVEEMIRAYMASGGVPPGGVPYGIPDGFPPPEEMLQGGPVPVMIDPMGFGMFMNMEGAPGFAQAADDDRIKEITDDQVNEDVAEGVTKIDISEKQDSEEDVTKDFVMVTPPGSEEKEAAAPPRTKSKSRSNSMNRTSPEKSNTKTETESPTDRADTEVNSSRVEPPQPPPHPNPVIAHGLEQLKEMGFNDENGQVTRLLELKAGNVERVLDILLSGNASLYTSETPASTVGGSSYIGSGHTPGRGGPYPPTDTLYPGLHSTSSGLYPGSYTPGRSRHTSDSPYTPTSPTDSYVPPSSTFRSSYSKRDRTFSGGNRYSSKPSFSRRRQESPAYENSYSQRDTPYSTRDTSYSSRGNATHDSETRQSYSTTRKSSDSTQSKRGRSYSREHSSPGRKTSQDSSTRGSRYRNY